MDKLIALSKEQATSSPFPPGSKVYIYDDSENPTSVNARGTISGVFVCMEGGTPDFLYKIDLNTSTGGNNNNVRTDSNSKSDLFRGKYLRFQNGTPVKIQGGYGNGNGNGSKEKEKMDGIILGSCDVPNDDRRRYTSDTFWYSIQILGSEDSNDGMCEIIHEVRPSDVTYRTIPTVVEFQTAPTINNIKMEQVIGIDAVGGGEFEGETQTETTATGSKRFREEDNNIGQANINSGGLVPLPPPPQAMKPLPTPPPWVTSGDIYNIGTGNNLPPPAKRQYGIIKHEEKDNNNNTSSSSLHQLQLPQSVDHFGRLESYNKNPRNIHSNNFDNGISAVSVDAPVKCPRIRNFGLRGCTQEKEYHAIIDTPFAKNIIMGPLIGFKGEHHKELMRKCNCFISIGGNNEVSAIGAYAENANSVENGVRYVKDTLFNYFKGQDLQRIQDHLEVEYFHNHQLVHTYKAEMPPKNKLRTEFSIDVDHQNLRLMLPETDFFQLRKIILGHDRVNLEHLKDKTKCKRIMAIQNSMGPNYVELFAHNMRTTEEGLYYVLNFLESKLGPKPDAFILKRDNRL